LVVYLAVRAFGWTPREIGEIDQGLLESLLMMHGEHERITAEEIAKAQKRRR